MDEVLVHKEHLDQIDFHTNHLRLGLNVKGTSEHWNQLTVEDCAELASVLVDTESERLKAVRDFCVQAVRWGVAHPEELEP